MKLNYQKSYFEVLVNANQAFKMCLFACFYGPYNLTEYIENTVLLTCITLVVVYEYPEKPTPTTLCHSPLFVLSLFSKYLFRSPMSSKTCCGYSKHVSLDASLNVNESGQKDQPYLRNRPKCAILAQYCSNAPDIIGDRIRLLKKI